MSLVIDMTCTLEDLDRRVTLCEKQVRDLFAKVGLLDDITIDHENRLQDIEKVGDDNLDEIERLQGIIDDYDNDDTFKGVR